LSGWKEGSEGVQTRKKKLEQNQRQGGNGEPAILVTGTISPSTGEEVGEGWNNTLRIYFDHEFGAG